MVLCQISMRFTISYPHHFHEVGVSSPCCLVRSLLILRVLIAPNQIWLTCEDPSALVTKYHEYLHGNPDRQAVLHGERRPIILRAGNPHVVPRKDLLQRYSAH